MDRQLTGGALFLIGFLPFLFELIVLVGRLNLGTDPFVWVYGILLILLGAGVYSGEILFEQESAGKYEAIILFYALIIIIMHIGVLFIHLGHS